MDGATDPGVNNTDNPRTPVFMRAGSTLPDSKAAVRQFVNWQLYGFWLAILCFLYLELFIFPDVPLVAYGDQSIYLLNATRMLAGQAIYRDFFQFTFPGTESIYFVLFKLFGVRAWIPDVMLILLGLGLTWLSIIISKKLMTGRAIFLAGLLFLTFAFRSSLDGTHHWYSTTAAIASLAVLIERRTGARLAAAGSLCGLAAWFTQSAGLAAVAGLALFLVWESRSKRLPRSLLLAKEGWLLASFSSTVVAFNAYFACKAGVARFAYCTLIFGIRYYPSDPFNTWRAYLEGMPSLHGWGDWFAVGMYLSIGGLLPLIYVAFFLYHRRKADAEPSQPWDRLMLVNLMGLFMFFGVAPAPSYLRLCSVSLPGFILLAWLLKVGMAKPGLRYTVWSTALLLLVAGPVVRQARWRGCLDLPTGRTAFLRRDLYGEYGWVFRHARPSDLLFGDQLINFTMGLPDPAKIDFITPTNYTRPRQVRSLLATLQEHRVRFVVWYRGLDQTVPGDRSGDHLEPLRHYLRSHYHIAETFANYDEIWEEN